MSVPGETLSRKPAVKVEAEELERILQARKNLDEVKALAIYGAHYLNLGWFPVALEALSGRDLHLDFSRPQTLRHLMDLALRGTRIQLAVRLDLPLFVLRVRPALARSLLDRLENWRSSCIARLGDFWEHHFLALPQGWRLGDGLPGEAPLSVLGPGKLVLVPPSLDPDHQGSWTWLSPPWEQPVGPPDPELLVILEECGFLTRKAVTAPQDLPSWKAIFPVVCHSDALLQALLAPEDNGEQYYRKILQEALRAGFRERKFLMSLLWHAPYGEARSASHGRHLLARWEEEIHRLLSPGGTACPSGVPEPLAPVPPPPAGPSCPEDLRRELQLLEARAAELERQLEDLDRLREGVEPPAGKLQPKAEIKDHLAELEELRRAVEEFLSTVEGLPDPEEDRE